MQSHETIGRMERLADAFEDLAIASPELRLDRRTASPAGAVGWERKRNFSVWLPSRRSLEEVSLFVRARGTDLELMSASTQSTQSENRPDLLEVDLTRDYRWSVANFEDEMRMARLLLAHMQSRLAAIDRKAEA